MQLLSQLRDSDADAMVITSRTNPEPMRLEDYMASYRHDEEHLEHLRSALAEPKVLS